MKTLIPTVLHRLVKQTNEQTKKRKVQNKVISS